ncbi:hypothetical protein F5144DRAFT_578053 [Chaetomium tenue]|uniref:Uncharacterized protein n=1 Tax=Chaetomium tenue TaxID=1854479 RepID=A0ACB7P2D1_9PEZI|nr:hypothetical protein F5144DRAFT_578053 [Chaetomium globosum]
MASSLQQTALEVILQQIPRWATVNIDVIGGLARLHHNPAGRSTGDVNFIVECREDETFDVSTLIRQDLESFDSTAFYQGGDGFRHRQPASHDGQQTSHRVPFFGRACFPYIPPSLQQVQRIRPGVVPYIQLSDLVVFKMHCCGLRSETQSKFDVLDAHEMLSAVGQPLILTPEQQDAVMGRLVDMTTHGPRHVTAQWWRQQLSLPPNFN